MPRHQRIARWLTAPRDYRDAVRRLEALKAKPLSLREFVLAVVVGLGSRGFYEVRAQQATAEFRPLAERVAALDPRVIVEIGVGRGGTGLLWAQLASDLVILCDYRPLWLERRLFRHFPRPGGPQLRFLRGDSHDPRFQARLRRTLAGRPIDFLFFDGDHTLEGIRQDFHDFRPLVRPGGLIACTDIVPQQPTARNHVHRFWEELKSSGGYQLEELVSDWDQIGYGIGVIRIPGLGTGAGGVAFLANCRTVETAD
ncbi:MAG TPA: class I SAM-dependent methyltransferase [bacterium]|nr:class I SAM-dependent methyltransferase [bacterium]